MMDLWYEICDFLPVEMLHWKFMQNAFLAVLIIAPLFGLTSTMVVTGRMSFFSDALGHSAFTGIAIGAIFGIFNPNLVSVLFALLFALTFSYIKSKCNQTADTLIGVFSSTAVALGVFAATFNGGSFTKFNKYLIGDILSVTPKEIGILAIVLIGVIVLWSVISNHLTLSIIYPHLASSRGVHTNLIQTVFTAAIAVIVTLSISKVGLLMLNSLMVLHAAISRNISKNLRQYHGYSILAAFSAGVFGLCISYYWGSSAGASISLLLSVFFIISLILRKVMK